MPSSPVRALLEHAANDLAGLSRHQGTRDAGERIAEAFPTGAGVVRKLAGDLRDAAALKLCQNQIKGLALLIRCVQEVEKEVGRAGVEFGRGLERPFGGEGAGLERGAVGEGGLEWRAAWIRTAIELYSVKYFRSGWSASGPHRLPFMPFLK